MAKVHKRASAKRDLVEHYVYLGEHVGVETAERFLANCGASFTDVSGIRAERPAVLALAEAGRVAQMAGERV